MRNIALAILTEVTEDGAYANIALRKALGQHTLDPRDRALVTELVNESLRNLGYIDAIINHFSTLPVENMKPFIRNVLRMSVCQLRVLTKIPPHAAVHEAVELAKSQGYSSLSGFVNGVLRAVVRKPNEPEVSDTSWATRYSYSAKIGGAAFPLAEGGTRRPIRPQQPYPPGHYGICQYCQGFPCRFGQNLASRRRGVRGAGRRFPSPAQYGGHNRLSRV
jgi:transcription termination factor NusB